MNPTSDIPKHILILRFSSVGDVILTAPALEALKTAWPTCRITYAVKQSCASLVRHNPHVDAIVALEPDEGVFHFARRLAETSFDTLLDWHGKMRSRILRRLLPPTRQVVWCKREPGDNLPVRLALKPYRPKIMLADRYHLAVEELVGRSLPRGRLRYYLGPQDQHDADAILRSANINLEQPIVGMSPGANWRTKRWPTQRFGGLAQRLIEQGLQVVINGSPDESALGRALLQVAPKAVDLTGRANLTELGGIISRCSAFIANDSGPMHMARALGVPTLAFFGSTSLAQFEWEGHQALSLSLNCAPCHFYGRRLCPRGHMRCLLDIDVEQAWQGLQPLLQITERRFVQA
ncbi:MAG: glycosyltransferase family 9 protein [Myxococcota bacterium]